MRRRPYYSCNATCRGRNAAATRREPNDHRRQVHRSMICAELALHLQGAVMNSKVSMMKSMVVAVALAAGVSGIARADDSSMSRFGGDSYAYFNNSVVDKAPSAWRQSNPNGLPERTLQAYSGVGEAWHLNKPAFDPSPSTFAQARP